MSSSWINFGTRNIKMAKTRKLVRRRLTRGRRVQKGRGQTFGRLRTPFRTQKTSNTYNNVKTVSNNSNKANGTGNNLFTRRKPVGTPQLSVKKVGNAAITEANKERLKGSYKAYKLAVNQFIDKYKEFVKLLEAKNYNIKAIDSE